MTRVLLVEDDAWLAEVEASTIADAGYEVVIAPHAPAAIELVDSFHPQVIVLDVLLAGSTAFALLNELQSYSDTGIVPVVLCTNIADQFEVKKLTEYGVKKIVDKTTMLPEDLVAAIKAVL
jgi:DNA-binding response OmpR family regulator